MNDAILLVEITERDKPGQVASVLSSAGYSFIRVFSLGMAFAELDRNDHLLIVVDLSGVKANGDRLVRSLHVASPHSTIVVFTTETNTRIILDLLRAGAWDCQILPVGFERLDTLIFQALRSERPRADYGDLRQVLYYDGATPKDTHPMQGFCLSLLGGEEALSGIQRPIIIIKGESGTGKTVVAETLHRIFAKPDCRMVRVDVSETQGMESGSGDLLEQLHRALVQARAGTLMLENINRLSQAQAEAVSDLVGPCNGTDETVARELLPNRVIMTYGSYARGACHGKGIIELFRRTLRPAEIQLPTLRSHREYIPDLVGQYLAYFRIHIHSPIRGVDSQAMRSLLLHPWPGNLRELTSVLEGASVLCRGHHLLLEHLPAELQRFDAFGQPVQRDGERHSAPAH